jgi:hypothetical protein
MYRYSLITTLVLIDRRLDFLKGFVGGAAVKTPPFSSDLSHFCAPSFVFEQFPCPLMKLLRTFNDLCGAAILEGFGDISETAHTGTKEHRDTQEGGFDGSLSLGVWGQAFPDESEVGNLRKSPEISRGVGEVDEGSIRSALSRRAKMIGEIGAAEQLFDF